MIHLDALRVTDDGQKQMVTGHITVKNLDGEVIEQMRPAKWYFRKHEEEPTTEVAIRRSFAEDLYIVMPAFEIEEQTASVEVHINPLVNWVWFGFGILAIGTGIALLPEASLSFAVAKLPAEAVTASVLLLSILLSSGAAFAQHVETGQDPRLQLVSPEAREVSHKLACWCGGCSKLPVGQCSCGHCAPIRAEVDAMLKEGKSEEQILQYYVAKFGGNQVLSEPPNSGSGRVVWAMPIVVGVGGFLTVAYLAMRWSRRPSFAGMPRASKIPRWPRALTTNSEILTDDKGTVPPALAVLSAGRDAGCHGDGDRRDRPVAGQHHHPQPDRRVGQLRRPRRVPDAVAAGVRQPEAPMTIGGRTRIALEREKTLVLRSIKELEFDFAMGKIAKADFDEMSGRLRARALGLMRQLDAGGGYREQIAKEVKRRLASRAKRTPLKRSLTSRCLRRLRDAQRSRREVLQELRSKAVRRGLGLGAWGLGLCLSGYWLPATGYFWRAERARRSTCPIRRRSRARRCRRRSFPIAP